MANSGGRNGDVTITTTSTASGVTVKYPAEPGPPAQAEHTDVFDPCPEPWLAAFRAALPVKADVSVNAGGAPIVVTAHK